MNTETYLTEKWRECDLKCQILEQENERIRNELGELKQRQEIALNNAYADGYEAGQADARQRYQKRQIS